MSDLLEDPNCRNRSQIILGYLKKNSSIIDRLYIHPATCLAVFRELPEVGRNVIMELLSAESAVSQKVIRSSVKLDSIKEYDVIAPSLVDLRVWQEETTSNGEPGWLLTSTFRNNLKLKLLGGQNEGTIKRPTEANPESKDLTFLDKYAIQQWESVLHCILEYPIESKAQGFSPALQTIRHAGLVLKANGQSTGHITQAGFQFLLMERSAQFWYFILKYLDTATVRNLDLVECLGFLFLMSDDKDFGLDYCTDGKSEGFLIFLQHLREFGLIYQQTTDSGRFYATRLALDSNCMPSFNAECISPFSMFVESDFRLFAYTESSLQIALMSTFSKILHLFPDFVAATITRESFYNALNKGITGDQIISFLQDPKHSGSSKTPPIVPPNVTDWMKLWEWEWQQELELERPCLTSKESPTLIVRENRAPREYPCLTLDLPMS